MNLFRAQWNLRSSLPAGLALGALLCCLTALPVQVRAQAAPAATWPSGDTSPEEQPLPGQMLGTNLTLNQGVGAINAENQSFDHYLLSGAASGGAQTNFFGTKTNHMTVGYAELSGSGGVLLRTGRTRFFALYNPQYYIYPQFTEVNNYDQRVFLSLEHDFTNHTEIGWSATAARYLSLNQYLPQSLQIGGIGVVVPTIGSVLFDESFEITNAATSLQLHHIVNERWAISGSASTGYFLLVPTSRAFSGSYGERFITSGVDVRLGYQLNPKDSIGVAATGLYFYGLTPRGHATVEALQLLYQRQLTAALKVEAGAGPLFVQSSSSARPGYQDINYALEGSISRQIRQSQFSAGYSRAFVVSYLGAPLIAHQATFSGYIPFSSRWILTSAATYTHESSSQYGGVLFGGSAQVTYLLRKNVQFFGTYSVLHENFTSGRPDGYAFTRNKFGAGVQFTLGNPVTPGGVH